MLLPANPTDSSSIFDSLMQKFDQSCQHLDLQILKLSQKRETEDKKKLVNLDQNSAQSNPYNDLQKLNDKSQHSTSDQKEVNNEMGTMPIDAAKIVSQKSGPRSSLLDTSHPEDTKTAANVASNKNTEIVCKPFQIVLQRNETYDKLALDL
jgi:hypothetical protein